MLKLSCASPIHCRRNNDIKKDILLNEESSSSIVRAEANGLPKRR